MLGSFFDKEQITKDTIQASLKNVSEELGIANDENFHQNFFIQIVPIDKDCNFKCFIAKKENNAVKFTREITVKEIVSGEE